MIVSFLKFSVLKRFEIHSKYCWCAIFFFCIIKNVKLLLLKKLLKLIVSFYSWKKLSMINLKHSVLSFSVLYWEVWLTIVARISQSVWARWTFSPTFKYVLKIYTFTIKLLKCVCFVFYVNNRFYTLKTYFRKKSKCLKL